MSASEVPLSLLATRPLLCHGDRRRFWHCSALLSQHPVAAVTPPSCWHKPCALDLLMQHKWLFFFLTVPCDKPQGRSLLLPRKVFSHSRTCGMGALGTCAPPVRHLAGFPLGKRCSASRALPHAASISRCAQELVSHRPLLPWRGAGPHPIRTLPQRGAASATGSRAGSTRSQGRGDAATKFVSAVPTAATSVEGSAGSLSLHPHGATAAFPPGKGPAGSRQPTGKGCRALDGGMSGETLLIRTIEFHKEKEVIYFLL